MLILLEPTTKKFERTPAQHNHDLLLLIFIFVLLLLLLLLLLVFVLILRRLLLFFFFFLLLFLFFGKIILIMLNPRLEIRNILRADSPTELFQILKDTLTTGQSQTDSET